MKKIFCYLFLILLLSFKTFFGVFYSGQDCEINALKRETNFNTLWQNCEINGLKMKQIPIQLKSLCIHSVSKSLVTI